VILFGLNSQFTLCITMDKISLLIISNIRNFYLNVTWELESHATRYTTSNKKFLTQSSAIILRTFSVVTPTAVTLTAKSTRLRSRVIVWFVTNKWKHFLLRVLMLAAANHVRFIYHRNPLPHAQYAEKQ